MSPAFACWTLGILPPIRRFWLIAVTGIRIGFPFGPWAVYPGSCRWQADEICSFMGSFVQTSTD
ncbi:hypothetical protein I7I53_02909 [Histoplasma capsulatum var. duboisii H88]|uniref:Uncharacterized protein n=1 Tax=Ajellomyces capsulatus (strain H88) TaxID=544711 RepID=A0A8A1LMP8_AJEC8|nr:hypothetical protein I7I53_02909 [Histoplasma capsulatum var. duboisii H88]